jgi:hypothetical protein
MGSGQLVGGGADVHAGVVEDEVVEVDKFAVEPQTGAGFGEMGPCDPTVADWASCEALVEAGEHVLGRRQRPGKGVELPLNLQHRIT